MENTLHDHELTILQRDRFEYRGFLEIFSDRRQEGTGEEVARNPSV